MSCYFCGYRFRLHLKEGENNCPKCKRNRDWKDKKKDAKGIESATKLRSYYYQQKTDQDIHPERIHKVSTMTDSAAGLADPQMYKVSTSYDPLAPPETVSTGWRPWSKIETFQVTPVCCSVDAFDRTYSRHYARRYAMPYNVGDNPKDFSYSTAYLGDRERRYNVPGANREVLDRPGRDYKSLLDTSYQVKSYNKKVAKGLQ